MMRESGPWAWNVAQEVAADAIQPEATVSVGSGGDSYQRLKSSVRGDVVESMEGSEESSVFRSV